MTAVSTLDAVGTTPLVELDAVGPADGARVVAKWEGANPTGSMKDRMAVAMIRAARDRGDLTPGQRVAERFDEDYTFTRDANARYGRMDPDVDEDLTLEDLVGEDVDTDALPDGLQETITERD